MDGEAATDYAIEVSGLNKSFGDKHVVNDFAIKVPRGRITGFLGPNGSGKTTTLRMLCGLLTPDSGEGRCLGHDIVTESDVIKRRVGYMTQKFSLYEDLTIEENLLFMARVHGLDHRHDRVDEALEGLGLKERRKQLAGKLSGGWKQRLALAATTLHEPDLLLLDEPTAGVDPQARRTFWDEIHTLSGRGLTVLVSTHYMDEAERCHDIAYISYGKLIARGTAEEILEQVGLVTFEGSGPGIDRHTAEIADAPGVENAAAFGTTLHVSGQDRAALEQAIAPWRRPPFNWRETPPTLEDAFIHLMSHSEDNFR
ncbi:MAG: ABC transporter ATP-binding protein [Hyphomonadaceae bacterium]